MEQVDRRWTVMERIHPQITQMAQIGRICDHPCNLWMIAFSPLCGFYLASL